MAPRVVEEGEGTTPPNQSSTSDQAQAQARARRKARKRDGPPQLQFLTATDPSQFKNEKAKRSVRSHAMADYRYKAEQQRRKSKGTGVAFAADEGTIPVSERMTPIMNIQGSYNVSGPDLMSQMMDGTQDDQHIYSSTLEAWWDLNRRDSSKDADAWAASRYSKSHSVVPLNAAAEKVIEFEESDAHEENQIRLIVSRLANAHRIGDGVDPFFAIPQFRSPGVNTLWLVRKCNRAFVSPATSLKWLPAMLSHPHILLSSVILASTYLDMHAGCSGDSKRTTLVKGEVIGFINERLQNSLTRFQDTTLMVMIHLLAGEMWSCHEKTLRIHQSGIARLIVQRGGMENLGGGGILAEVSAASCYHCDIFCEATPLPIFLNWQPSRYAPFKESVAVPESPLFCPRSDFMTITKDPGCSPFTYSLLCDMRDLTDMFIAHNARLNEVSEVEIGEDFTTIGSSISDYDRKVGEIRARLAALPSAYAPGLPTSGDFLYEACRIAALIYTAAIIMRVPFSVAAEPSRNPILTDTASLTNSPVGGHLLTTRLTEALYEVLDKTPTTNVWNDMAGVLYWVSLVGAAAARTPVSINMSRPPRTRDESYATWIRRCLIMFSTRTWLVLLFPHPIPIIMAQKKMLRVQELLNTDRSRILVS